jgi:TetR/AcrR family acrAB operon transcriptional repressor
MKRTLQQALATRDRILDAAESVFAEYGVSCATLEAVAKRAGFTRGAVYGHFRSKSDLLLEVTMRMTMRTETLVIAVVDAAQPDPLGRIRQFLMYCLSTAVIEPRSRRVFEVLYTRCERTHHADVVFDRQRDTARTGRKQLELGLSNAIARGQLPRDLDTARASSVIHAFLGGVLRDWLLQQNSIALPRDAEYLTDVCIGMLTHLPSLRREADAEPALPAHVDPG